MCCVGKGCVGMGSVSVKAVSVWIVSVKAVSVRTVSECRDTVSRTVSLSSLESIHLPRSRRYYLPILELYSGIPWRKCQKSHQHSKKHHLGHWNMVATFKTVQ